MDEYVIIKITKLTPGQHVTLRCETTVKERFIYDSHAHFIASLTGVVDVSQDPSFGGCYKGIDRMGIFANMLPALGQLDGLCYCPRKCTDPMEYRLQIYDGHITEEGSFTKSNLLHCSSTMPLKPIATGFVMRRFYREGVERIEVNHGRVRGTIFKPAGPGPFKGVIDIYGTFGGIIETRASMLASHGYIAFSLAYFRYLDLPKKASDVELEYFLEAIDYFTSLPSVQPNIGFIAYCAGGPVGLFLSIACPNISALITIAAQYTFINSPMIYKGERTGFIFDHIHSHTQLVDKHGGTYSKELLDHVPIDEIAIPIEKSNCRYLVITGTDDKSINALRSGQYLVQRMKKHGKEDQITLLAYPGAGHVIDPPFMPKSLLMNYADESGMKYLAVGGDALETSLASIHSWRQTLIFLKNNVGNISKL